MMYVSSAFAIEDIYKSIACFFKYCSIIELLLIRVFFANRWMEFEV